MTKKILMGAAVALFMLTSCSGNSGNFASAPSFDDVLSSRRSVRSYDATKKISEEEVRELLTATQEAPSWANQQPTKYYVAISPDKVAAVQDLVGMNKDRIAGAPVLIVSTFERGKSGFFQGNQTNEIGDGWGAYDNGLSNCYLILKARAMGFDTLIMGMRDASQLRQLFTIPESETADPSTRLRASIDQLIILALWGPAGLLRRTNIFTFFASPRQAFGIP